MKYQSCHRRRRILFSYYNALFLILLLMKCNQASGNERKKTKSSPKPQSDERNQTDHSLSVETDSLHHTDRETLHDIDEQSHQQQHELPALNATDGSKKRLERISWQRTLAEIRSLVVPFTPPKNDTLTGKNKKTTINLLDRWKLLLEGTGESSSSSWTSSSSKPPHERKQRFEGFASWERRLQQWAEDVSDYLEKNLDQPPPPTGNEYPFSSYGVPPKELKEASRLWETITPNVTQTPKKARVSLNVPVKPSPVKPNQPVVPHTNLSDKSLRIWIVTTAALPWMTGTAVNPLLRAAYMNEGRRDAGGSVTILLPWLEKTEDRKRVYGERMAFETQHDQEEFIRNWLREEAKMEKAAEELRIEWYVAWQERAENSIYSMGDITALIPEDAVDVCVLEEPEHLNWYRAPGESWTIKFPHVIGIVHTNYFVYAQEQPAALIRAPAMRLLCAWMCRAHCHRVIKLSGTLGSFAPEKELVENVHGVRRAFLDAGDLIRAKIASDPKTDPVFGSDVDPKVYFIGKMLWSKGLGSLMELMKYAEESAGLKVKVDMYGGGPNKEEAEGRAKKMGLEMPFHGPIDHAKLAETHKIFINPSTSEVLCTTVAEALAMGKFVVVPSHPSNDFFAQFPNCLPYANKEEFVGNLYYAMTHAPEPLTEEYSYALSWKAATERFEAAGSISVAEAEAMAHALNTTGADLEISLPQLIEREQLTKIAATLKLSRERFRQFRSRLSQEIQQSDVLPKYLTERIIKELDKRLDLDLDKLHESPSPKLRLKLSPAELDQQLLEIYNGISVGPGGDALRVIGGGTTVGMQNLYLRKMAVKRKRRMEEEGELRGKKGWAKATTAYRWNFTAPAATGLLFADEVSSSSSSSTDRVILPAEWVKKALNRNLPSFNQTMDAASTIRTTSEEENEETKMEESVMRTTTTTTATATMTRNTRHANHPKMALQQPSLFGTDSKSRVFAMQHTRTMNDNAIRWKCTSSSFYPMFRPSISFRPKIR